MFSTIQDRNRRFTPDFDGMLLNTEKMNSFPIPINMLPHAVDAKYQRKRNPERTEQAGSKEKE
jgi:hypothetical protein